MRPYVAAACICEKVLQEPDGVASLIRIVDTYRLEIPDPLPPGAVMTLGLNLFISIKSGDVSGPHQVQLALRQPNGKTQALRSWPVVLNGQEHGSVFNIAFTLAPQAGTRMLEMGVYWFDVLWDDGAVLTSIPLRLTPAVSTPAEAASR